MNWKNGGPPKKFLMDGTLHLKAEKIANLQMDYFQKKLIKIKSSLGTTNEDPLRLLRTAFTRWKPVKAVPVFEIQPISLRETVKLISKMSNSTSRGSDNIDGFAVKAAAVALHKPIQHVINQSIIKGKFPTRWKLGRIKPLLKNFELDDLIPDSYCPICLLPTLSKLTERVVQSQLLEHLESTNQLHRDHHAYRDKLNTTSALLQITTMIYKSTDLNKITATMSVDMSAAFDCIRHKLILKKLPFYNVGKHTCDWIQSYLEYRSNYVEIGDKQSRIQPAPTGVPQGSCLGPLLYLIAMNELPETVHDENCSNEAHENTDDLFGSACSDCGSLPVYADDGIFLFTGRNRPSNQSRMERSFKAIKVFLAANGLAVNDGKTALTEIMSKQKRGRLRGDPPKVKVQILEDGCIVDKTIEDRKVCRFLGVNIQNNQSWAAHISTGKKAIVPAIKRQIGSLYHLRNFIPWRSRLMIANAIIIGKLTYAIPLWGGGGLRLNM